MTLTSSILTPCSHLSRSSSPPATSKCRLDTAPASPGRLHVPRVVICVCLHRELNVVPWSAGFVTLLGRVCFCFCFCYFVGFRYVLRVSLPLRSRSQAVGVILRSFFSSGDSGHILSPRTSVCFTFCFVFVSENARALRYVSQTVAALYVLFPQQCPLLCCRSPDVNVAPSWRRHGVSARLPLTVAPLAAVCCSSSRSR